MWSGWPVLGELLYGIAIIDLYWKAFTIHKDFVLMVFATEISGIKIEAFQFNFNWNVLLP